MIELVAKSDESPVRLNAREERARKNLERFITESGYSVTQVADLTGIAQATLARYVNGKSPLPFDALQPLVDALGRESILDFQDPNPKPNRHKDELAQAQPIFARARPGFEPTEEDMLDFQDYLKKVQARREKKKPKSSR
jgi:transcriptional regulator with XRE-family HTH domain